MLNELGILVPKKAFSAIDAKTGVQNQLWLYNISFF